jgi:DNA-binding response OmpR family regulator
MPTSQASPKPSDVLEVLLVSSLPETHASLRQIFGHSNWLLHEVSTCREALAYLRDNNDALVICERDLPDGDWKIMLSTFDSLPMAPNLIVTSRMADERLWAEVLSLGGYDVLVQPFEMQEVYREVFLAWHAQKRRALGPVERESGPPTAGTKSRATT